MTNQAIVIHAANDLRVEPVDTTAPGQDEVQIKMHTGGICGSDLHYFNHGGFGAIRLREPMILGHEVAGHITALGAGVQHLKIGDLVAVSPSRPCNSCIFCLKGEQNHCLNMRFYGSAMPFPHIQGAFRQFLTVSAAQCAPAEGLTPAEAAMAEPLAVCLHAVRQAGYILGKRVLVTGCGPIGLLTILAARRAGAVEIIATDLSDFTLEIAARNGADRVINIAKTPDALNDYTSDKGQIDVLFECTGAAIALQGAIPTLRPGGTIIQLGLGGDMTLPVQAMTAKELVLRGSFRFHPEFFVGVKLMQSGLIDVKPLISHSLPLEKAMDAFGLASDRTQSTKVHITF